ncbi:MAG: TorF family putative porin [Thiohalomonadales bacterium]
MILRHKLYVLFGVATISLGISTAALAEIKINGELSGNLAVTSTYMWRGKPQSTDAAVQGGVDYVDPIGLVLGAWTSNVSNGSELDLVIAYAGNAKNIDFGGGLIVYRFPQADGDFEEFYAHIGQGGLSAKFSTSSDYGQYFEFAGVIPITTWDMTLHFGYYDVDNDPNYADYSVVFTKPFDRYKLAFMLSDTDLSGDSYRTTVSLSTDFKP